MYTRDQLFTSLTNTNEWDVAIIGGGATGLGIAVDAASRGYKTILLEKYDFAKSTSSKSTKLVHGGVRYLANGDVKLVYSALHERGLIFKNAPHVSSVQRFIIPTYSFFSKMKFLIGLKLYDWMAGKYRIGTSKSLSKETVLNYIPKADPNKLNGGIQYYDGQFDDARLALLLAKTAIDHGATVLNYADVTKIAKNSDNKVSGISFKDTESGNSYSIQAKTIINATGIFVDDILKMEEPNHKNLVRPSQGTHIVVDPKFLGGNDALMIPETSDGRVLFGVPWNGKVLLGTTDTPLNEHQIEPRPLEEEIKFILDTANSYLKTGPQRKDVLSAFSGLRPLAAPKQGDENSTKEISRDHKLIVNTSGLITITGGKWTTYRKMAEDTVDMAIKTGGLPEKSCQTKELKIHAYSTEHVEGHWRYYGSDLPKVKAIIQKNDRFKEKIHSDHPYLMGEVVWVCENEMVCKLEDVLNRRFRLLLLDAKAALQAAPDVAKLMAETLGKDQLWVEKEIQDFSALARQYIIN